MCNSCGVSGCGCDKKRFNGKVDRVMIPGPQGIQGEQGIQGVAGTNGSDGAAGGMQYEHFFTASGETNWGTSETVQPEFNHTVTADGNYQITLNLRTFMGGNGFGASGTLYLYINGIAVDQINMALPNLGIFPSGEQFVLDNVIIWRGAMLNTETIEVKHIAGVNSNITTDHMSMLVNKES